MKRNTRTILSSVLCLSMFLSMNIFASAETSSKKQNLINISRASNTGGISTSNTLKNKLDECITVYNDYQKVKSSRAAKTPDSYTIVYTIDGNIKQIDVSASSEVKKTTSTNYVMYNKLSICYYYSDDGYPRFALITDKSGVKNKEYRMYLYGGEVIKWVDNDGDEYYTAPTNMEDLYDVAVANYARAMYDCYEKGKYIIQVGCFADETEAESCKASMTDLGEEVTIVSIDDVYCVVCKYYFDNWEDAAEYAGNMNFSDDCGSILVRLK